MTFTSSELKKQCVSISTSLRETKSSPSPAAMLNQKKAFENSRHANFVGGSMLRFSNSTLCQRRLKRCFWITLLDGSDQVFPFNNIGTFLKASTRRSRSPTTSLLQRIGN